MPAVKGIHRTIHKELILLHLLMMHGMMRVSLFRRLALSALDDKICFSNNHASEITSEAFFYIPVIYLTVIFPEVVWRFTLNEPSPVCPCVFLLFC